MQFKQMMLSEISITFSFAHGLSLFIKRKPEMKYVKRRACFPKMTLDCIFPTEVIKPRGRRNFSEIAKLLCYYGKTEKFLTAAFFGGSIASRGQPSNFVSYDL